jgi:hypothetical protein
MLINEGGWEVSVSNGLWLFAKYLSNMNLCDHTSPCKQRGYGASGGLDSHLGYPFGIKHLRLGAGRDEYDLPPDRASFAGGEHSNRIQDIDWR